MSYSKLKIITNTKLLAVVAGLICSGLVISLAQGIVICGVGSDPANACKITDIFRQANQLAGFIIKIVFPVVFFFGLFMVAWPLVNQLGEPSGNALAIVKGRAKKLAIGTVFIVGAFLIVRAILSAVGYRETDTIVNPVRPVSLMETIIEISPIVRVEAQGFLPNPLADVSVQKATLGVANVFAYIIIVASILGVIRGVILLMLTQENPDNLKKGRTWILRSLAAAAIIMGAQLFFTIISGTVSSVFG